MGTIIKHSRQTALLLSAFSALSLYSMEQDGKKPELLSAKVFQDSDTGNKSKERFMSDQTRQKMAYHIRACLIMCASRPFDEKWHYKTSTQEVENDKAKTFRSLSLLNNCSSYTFFCTQNCLKQHGIRLSPDEGPRILVKRCKEKLNNFGKK